MKETKTKAGHITGQDLQQKWKISLQLVSASLPWCTIPTVRASEYGTRLPFSPLSLQPVG